MKPNNGSAFSFDLDQNPAWSTPGSWVPTLLTHGTLIEARAARPLLGQEHLLVMGAPVSSSASFECGGFRFMLPYQSLVDDAKLGSACMKRLAGNAMRPARLGSFILHCLSHCLPLLQDLSLPDSLSHDAPSDDE